MSSPTDFDSLHNRVAGIAPVSRQRLDSPYEISNDLYAALRHVLHDGGGQPDLPTPYLEKDEEAWEMNTYVTCECLGWRGGVDLRGAQAGRERPRRHPVLRRPDTCPGPWPPARLRPWS